MTPEEIEMLSVLENLLWENAMSQAYCMVRDLDQIAQNKPSYILSDKEKKYLLDIISNNKERYPVTYQRFIGLVEGAK